MRELVTVADEATGAWMMPLFEGAEARFQPPGKIMMGTAASSMGLKAVWLIGADLNQGKFRPDVFEVAVEGPWV